MADPSKKEQVTVGVGAKPKRGITLGTVALAAMSAVAAFAVVKLSMQRSSTEERVYSLWAILPFVFSFNGSTLGVLYDLFFKDSPFDDIVSRIRSANVPYCFGAIIFAFFMLGLSPFFDEHVIDTFLFFDIAFTFVLSLYAFSGGFPKFVIGSYFVEHMIMYAILALSVFFDTQESTFLAEEEEGRLHINKVLGFFAVATTLEFVSLLIVKMSLDLFHFLNILTLVFLYLGSHFYEGHLPATKEISLRFTGILLAAFVGVNFVLPQFSDRYRYFSNSQIWNTVYAMLMRQPIQYPPPLDVNIEAFQPPINKTTYNVPHPRAAPIAVICADHVPKSSQFHFVMIRVIFHIIMLLDKFFPQNRIEKSLFVKPRLKQGETAKDYHPNALAYTGPAPVTTDTVAQAKRDGQLLAYLAQHGHATCMIEKKENGEIVMDFDSLHDFEMKSDYKKYGGKAFFEYDHHAGKLVLKQVSPPDSDERIDAVAGNSNFKQVEDILLASSLVNTVAGKHCCGIHTYMNLLPIALHNTFDTKHFIGNPPRPHPFRVLLYIHCYNHIMVEELTTAHLLDKTGIFPQIFGFSHNGLAEYYNNFFNKLNYAEDADFEKRQEVYGGKAPENSQLHWEMIYHRIHTRYAHDFVHIFYKDDKDVQDDNLLQSFKDELNSWLPNKLPERHNFQTRDSVIRFIADTMHVFTVRHEVYGTNTVKYALDPAILSSQVPIDHGLPSIEEYYSLLTVAYATSRVSFGKMMTDRLKELLIHFPDHKDQVAAVFDNLQTDYHKLEDEWTADDNNRARNKEYMRNIPSDLETGAGY